MKTELFMAALPCVGQLISENRTALVNSAYLQRRRIELGLVRACFQVWVTEAFMSVVDTDIDSDSDFVTDDDSDFVTDDDSDYSADTDNESDINYDMDTLNRWQPVTVAVAFMIFVAPVLENGVRR